MHSVLSTWRYASVCTRNLLGFLLKLIVVAYFLFCALFLGLRYIVLPNIDSYKPAIQELASRELGAQVTASSLQASWRGLRPHLVLNQVVVHDNAGQPALILPKVLATVSWSSLLVADLRLHYLEIQQPDMTVRRDVQGNLHVGGILVDMRKEGDGKGVDWVLSQRKIVIQGGRLSWQDDKRNAPPLALQNVDLVLRNAWRRHRFAVKATPPASVAGPIDIRADFEHPHFATRIADPSRWKGELYADLQNADLAVWKSYLNYPFELTRGQGSVRAWLNFDNARVANFSADLSLSDVSARLQSDLEPLALSKVEGHISVKEEINPAANEGTPTFGALGHAVELRDFSFTTVDGLVFPATTLSERFTPAQGKQPEKFEVRAKLLDLHTLASFAERLPLAASQRELLKDFSPRGQLHDFSVQWQGSYPNLTAYRVKGQFAGLSMNAQSPRPAQQKTAHLPAQAAIPGIPGFDNLSGSIDASDKGGSFLLHSSQLVLNLPGYFSEPELPFEKLDMQASWSFQKEDHLLLQIDEMDFRQDGIAGSLSGKHLMPVAKEEGMPLGKIDLSGKIEEMDLRKLGRYLPLQTPKETREWLAYALEQGTVRDVSLKIKGNLSDFPFQSVRPHGKAQGEFRVAGKISNGRLNYAPGSYSADGKSPLWPTLDDIEGTIVFNQAHMEIRAESAQTGRVALSKVKAVIPNLLADHPMLDIEGQAAGALQEFIRYVNASPVAGWVANFTESVRASGNAQLALKLQMPLDQMQNTKVQGSLQFAGNDVALFDALPTLFATNGKLEFNETGFVLPAIRANFLGGPVHVTGGTQRDGTIAIKASGGLTADGVRKTYASPTMDRIGQRFKGGTRYTAAINVKKNGRLEIKVDSALQGIGLDFPQPLRKTEQEIMPFKLELAGKAGQDAASTRDEIKMSLGTAVAAYYEREKAADQQAAWRVVRGGIGINVPAPQPDSGVVTNVSMHALNIDDWSRLVSSILGTGKADPVAQPNAPDLAQYIQPEVLAARATELIIGGKKLNNVVVGASYQNGTWQANIDSEQASGYVTWNENAGGQGVGKVTARLASLSIPSSAASDVSDLLEGKQTTTQMPELDIVAENFELFDKHFGQLELLASNIAARNKAASLREWRINKLSIINPDGELKARGKWLAGEQESATSLTYTLNIVNAGKMLDRFGFKDVVRGGKGQMQGDLSWKGLPFSLDIPTLTGQLSLNLGAGQFLKGDPSAAKLLGVLSLQSLPRRLSLDFRDVFSEGFAFDGIVGSATIDHGIVVTDNFKMRSLSATVLMDGSADINKEISNLHVAIIPEINAGAASVVYGLAVNPVIGLGTFLAQLFLRNPLMKAFTFEYQITGPWKDPVVTRITKNGLSAGTDPVPNTVPNTGVIN